MVMVYSFIEIENTFDRVDDGHYYQDDFAPVAKYLFEAK